MQKILAFEHFKRCIGTRYQADTENTIVLMKLLFFTAAIRSSPSDKGLLQIFDKFYAMPFGHVEGDVYNQIRKAESEKTEERLLASTAMAIDHSLEELNEVNNKIFTMPPFDLVELSHRWYSWKTFYNAALEAGKKSLLIPSIIIQREEKIFHL